MRCLIVKAIALSAGLAISANAANAAVVTMTYDVVGSNFSSGVASPYASITESFTVTFNTTMLPLTTTTGISLNASTITPTSTLGFQYIAGADTLIVGGIAATVATADPASTDFAITINNASKGANYGITSLSYSVGTGAVFTANTTAIVVPEPASIALLGTAAAAFTFMRRRRAN